MTSSLTLNSINKYILMYSLKIKTFANFVFNLAFAIYLKMKSPKAEIDTALE